MHALIINGSPRVQKYSNTERIIEAFGAGLESQGWTYEHYAVSDRAQWDVAREAYAKNDEIIIALSQVH